ncbi:hypothetical protein C8R45DRAFT_941825 [Mycena sanguinolenta]|nr:hypothetical protein C8R45DRAFT_941825 [Mycena sanguinolenta]
MSGHKHNVSGIMLAQYVQDRVCQGEGPGKREATVTPPSRPGYTVLRHVIAGAGAECAMQAAGENGTERRCALKQRLWDEFELVLEAVHERIQKPEWDREHGCFFFSCLGTDTAPGLFHARSPLLLRGEAEGSGGSFSLIRAYQRCTGGRLAVCSVQNIRVKGKSRYKSGGEELGDGRERLRERDQSPRTIEEMYGTTVKSTVVDYRPQKIRAKSRAEI